MAIFDLAIPKLLIDEGGWSDDPVDRGGATKWGITFRFLQSIRPSATLNDLRNMTREQAAYIYRTEYWDKYGLNDFISQIIATKVLDFLPNVGPYTFALIVQKALNDFYGDKMVEVKEDGIYGKQTKIHLSGVDEKFLPYLKLREIEHYIEEVEKDPKYEIDKLVLHSQLKNLRGWIKRALS